MNHGLWFTAEEIGKLRGVTYGTVRNMACTYKWRRLGTSPQRYHIEDVLRSLNPDKH